MEMNMYESLTLDSFFDALDFVEVAAWANT